MIKYQSTKDEEIIDTINNFDKLSLNNKLYFFSEINISKSLAIYNNLLIDLKSKLVLLLLDKSNTNLENSLQLIEVITANLEVINCIKNIITTQEEDKIIDFFTLNKDIFIKSSLRTRFLLRFSNISQKLSDFVQEQIFNFIDHNKLNRKYSNADKLELLYELCLTSDFANKKKIFYYVFSTDNNYAKNIFLKKFKELQHYATLL